MKDPEKFKERMGNFMKGLLAKQKENQAKRDAAKAADGAKDMIFVLEPYEQVQLYDPNANPNELSSVSDTPAIFLIAATLFKRTVALRSDISGATQGQLARAALIVTLRH